MAQQIQFRRGTTEEWAAANPVLADGELGWERDTGKFKIGDGIATWSSLGYASGSFALSAKLTALSDVGSYKGLLENTGADTVSYRPIGVSAETSIPTRADVDTRFARMFGAMPAGSVGKDGDYGLLDIPGYRCVLIKKTSGAWGMVGESFTWEQMQAIPSPSAGLTVFVTTIDLKGNVGQRNLDTLFRFNGSKWRPLSGMLVLTSDTGFTATPNASTSFNLWRSMVPPVGLLESGSQLEWNIRSRPVPDSSANSGATHQPTIRAGGTTISQPNNNTAGFYSGTAQLWCEADNVLSGGGPNQSGWGDGTSTSAGIERTGPAFDGSRTLELGFSSNLSDSSKSWGLAYSRLVLYPPH